MPVCPITSLGGTDTWGENYRRRDSDCEMCDFIVWINFPARAKE